MEKIHMVGILLAGGLSRRYGSPKAFAEINGKKFHEIAYDILAELCDDVIIVTRPELVRKRKFPKNLRVIADEERFLGCGPLAGIYSAMVEETANHYVVLPCDMPLLTADIVGKLIATHKNEVTVTVVAGRTQPLVSVWNRSTFEKIKTTLMSEKYKMTEVFKKTDVEYIDASSLTSSAAHVFMNVNTLEEDKEARIWKQGLS